MPKPSSTTSRDEQALYDVPTRGSSMTTPQSISGVDALIVFVNHTECHWLTWLQPGFRHCVVALRFGDRWVVCDSLKNSIEFYVFDLPHKFDLASFYTMKGHIVLAGTRLRQPDVRRLALDPLTCVAIAKRMIGFRSIWVQTPWQLFRALLKAQGQQCNWRLCPPSGKRKTGTTLGLTVP